ncbi:MAG: NAD(P)-binding domain-containing protein [Bacteroidetes bacterium]|jgi:lysine 6-dehydrogenase|nr:NAD(P)-binding domain-containing protein [Bacteroidota bacterium]MBT4401228.1 NAD(P)-binding domain-containing protein [Bacteroidota bacterium]MBT4411470.1 NAD(P)-binding domain-containing protein [Bacteroidota bacterium]MBT7465954.1 NAD(P)-binding domain-containing protein [Bacteroidota bacterium]
MSKIVVLGCGAVGKYMAIDLCKDPSYEVISVDVNREALEQLASEYPIQIRVEDLSSAEGVTRAVEDADIVIGSVPYSIGYSMLENVIRAGKNIVDISYFMEDPFGLDELAKANGVTAVVDCGVVPGMGNIILGDRSRKMKVTRYECYVGGVPKSRKAPLGYKSPFPVLEVLEEYIENGTMVENGKVVVRPMLSETMTIDIDKVGTMACLNSDGLRTLIHTMDIPDMFEKTLRYPNHVDQMRVFKDTGLLNTTPIKVEGVSVRPIDVMTSLLSPLWKYELGEADITVMKLVISGVEDGKQATYTYSMYDEYDPATGALSMARTTGYTCNAVTRLVLDGTYSQKGISPPEFVGRADGCWTSVEKYLEDRGVKISKR